MVANRVRVVLRAAARGEVGLIGVERLGGGVTGLSLPRTIFSVSLRWIKRHNHSFLAPSKSSAGMAKRFNHPASTDHLPRDSFHQ